jgi:hypothetical protein
VWLPGVPPRLLRWLARPFPRSTRAIVWIGAVLMLVATRLPSNRDPLLLAAVWTGISAALAMIVAALAGGVLRFYHDSPAWTRPQPNRRSIVLLVWIVMPFLLLVRPSFYFCFALSRPAMERIARQIAAEPFANPLPPPQRVGVFYVVFDKCPHFVAMHPMNGWEYTDWGRNVFGYIDGFNWDVMFQTYRGRRGSAIVYRYDRGGCERHTRYFWGRWELQG